MNPPPFRFEPGRSALLISVPHAGTCVPPEIQARLTPAAKELPDTDWHVPRLYEAGRALGATFLIAEYSRYVVDLNRPPDGTPLYPGQAETGVWLVDADLLPPDAPRARLPISPCISTARHRMPRRCSNASATTGAPIT
jgi:N-formylglutamate deformylase